MEACIFQRIFRHRIALQNGQGGFDGVEERDRLCSARLKGNGLGNIAEDHIRGYVHLCDLIAAHRHLQENTALLIRGGGGGVVAIDLFNFVGHTLDGAVISNVFLQNLKARFLVVLEPGFRGLSGSERHSLLGMAENVGRRNRFLAQNVNTGGQRFQRGCSVFSGRHGGRIAAGYGFDRNHRIGDWFSGKCVRFDDFQIWEFLILRCDSVLFVSIGDIHIDTVGRRVQREALRSLSLHEGPQSLGNIVYLDDSPIGRHIAANDLTVPIDVIDGAI